MELTQINQLNEQLEKKLETAEERISAAKNSLNALTG